MRLLLLFLLSGIAAQAQHEPFYQHFTERDGLSNDQVHCLLRDRMGYLWIGTAYGLNRYDGYGFRQYLPDARQPDRTVCHEIITGLDQDSSGYLWIGTRNGLNRYDPRTGQFKTWRNKGREDGSLPSSLITSLLTEGPNRLWLCCDNRDLTLMDTRNFTFTTLPWKAFASVAVPAKKDNSYKTIYRIARKSAQELWLYTNLGIFSFHTETRKFAFHADQKTFDPETPDAQRISHTDQQGLTWTGDQHGLHLLDPDLQYFRPVALLPKGKNEPKQPFYRLLSTGNGRACAINYEGRQLFIIESERITHRLPLPGTAALLFEDSQRRIWVGAGSKLFHLNPHDWTLQPIVLPEHPAPARHPFVFLDMAEDSRGNLWFASDEAGVLVWMTERKMWWKPSEAEGYISRNTSCVFADKARKTVWIGTQDYGLFRYDEPTGRFHIYQREEDHPETSLGAYIVNSICRDALGYLWVATDPGGISRFDYDKPESEAFKTLRLQDGLPSNQVISIQTDKAGNIWAGTPKGLAWVDAKTLQVRTFDRKNGLRDDAVNVPISRSADGRLFLGTETGFTAFYPAQVLRQKTDNRILLTSLKVFEKELADSPDPNFLDQLTLTWQQRFFVFEFMSTNFSQTEKTTYAYRLRGFNDNWIDLGKARRAAFTNVPPGDYLFEVKAGREGVWQAPGLQLPVVIAPPFWKTWWFYTLAFLLLTGLLYALWRYRIGQVRREEALKTVFNQRIARVEMAALRAQMNPHFVFNCLSSINRFILVNEPGEASAYLTKFSRLIRLILDNSRSDKVALDRELEALRLYIELEAMRFGQRFVYDIDVSPEVQTQSVELPPLLLQPFVENAIWHGLMHKTGPGKLSLRLFHEADALCMVIEDDGVGRKRAMELKSKSAVEHKSHGLAVTAERLELIRALYAIQAETVIEDLYQEDGTPAGTRVTIRLQ